MGKQVIASLECNIANLYSVCAILADYHEPNGADMYFVGIFDEKNLRNGIKEFIWRTERKKFPPDVSDEYVREIVESDVDEEFLEKIVHDKELIFILVGTTYHFKIQKTECNKVNEVQMMFLPD